MDPEEASAEGQMGADLKGAVDRLHSAMQKRWETEEWEASLAYEISIPAQTLTIYGKEHAEYVLRSLKGLRVSGMRRTRHGRTTLNRYPGMGMPSTIPRYCPYCGTRRDVHYCKEETPDVDK